MIDRFFKYKLQDHLESLFKYFNNSDLSNVILVCDDESKILTNKLILSSFSSFLSKIILDTPEEIPMIKIEGAKFQDVKLLMNLFCTGQATLSQKQLDCLLSVANQLDLDISKFDLKEIDTLEFNTYELQDNRSFNNQNAVTTEPQENRAMKNQGTYTTNEVQDNRLLNEYELQMKRSRGRPQGALSKNPKAFTTENSSFRMCECQKLFKTKEGYEQHVQAIHKGVRPYPCPYCEYKAHLKQSLESHIQAVHAGIKYPCDMCDYKAPQKGHIKRHKLTVHGFGLRYPCTYCQKTFSCNQTFQRHMREVHVKDRFPCSLCDFVGYRQDHFNSHMRKSHLQGAVETMKEEKREKIQIDAIDYTRNLGLRKLNEYQMHLKQKELGKTKGVRGRPKGSLDKKTLQKLDNMLFLNKIEDSETQGLSHDTMYSDSIYSEYLQEYQNEHQNIVDDLKKNFVKEQPKEFSDNITHQKPTQSVSPTQDYHAEEVQDEFIVHDPSIPDGIQLNKSRNK